MAKLTKRSVDGAKAKETDYFVWDTELHGFGLRVMSSGRKSYVIQYRNGSRTRRLTIGKVGTFAPDEARKHARDLLATVHKGADPSEERHKRRMAPTVAALCDRFMSDHVAHHCKPSTKGEYQRSVDLFIKPKLGPRNIIDITRPDIADLHNAMRDKPYQANRTLGVLSKMFNLAEVWGLRPDGSNPCRHVRKYREEKRERFLDAEELATLGEVLDAVERDKSESEYAVAAFRLLILTGCRLGEIQTLRWEYIQGNRLALPDSKTGAKTVHLGQKALDVLAAVPRKPDNPYVIAGEVEGQHLTDLQRPWRRIRALAGLEGVRIHDLRHSFASMAIAGGESLPMIGRLLGHTNVQTTARYAHLADELARSAASRVSDALGGHLARRKSPSAAQSQPADAEHADAR